MKKIRLITDGSCLGNPGPGGWACILKYNEHIKEMYGYEPQTTNNRMELTAAVRGLRALKEPCEVTVVTDSEYVKNGITKWVVGWKRNGWKTSNKEPVKNKELWEELDRETARHKAQWQWTKGHADDEENNRCDELAQAAARQQIQKL